MRVLVTRPEPAASRTAAHLAARGFEPLLLPLTRIEPLPEPDDLPPDCDAVIVTSANALRHASPDLLGRFTRLPCFAVGNETAAKAAEAGFARVESGQGDASVLAELVRTRLPAGARLVYLCGRLRRMTLERTLSSAGFDIVAVETYETLPMDYGADDVSAHIGEEPVAVVTLFSAEAALAFLRLVKSVTAPALSGDPRLLCISTRVAAALGGQRFETLVAPEPTEASMLSRLRDLSPAQP